ncbi:MAG: 3-alpha,7-alpha,12-alpha-trihydroxy-5-beta-cholest-24-enoyl-CoA hydratase [Dehalococcoidia bacterium]|nr:3-alpha,7-alpha,12-alpha-trihydroxy-5-beta-cholest-24-enoyl-CoA hydratase [Dehalococcoidia bacterium]
MAIDLNLVGQKLPPTTFEYDERDVMLYALGIGAGADELQYVYEPGLKVIPTFGVVPAFPALAGLVSVGKLNPVMLLHGEQRLEVKKPFPRKAKVITVGTVRAIYDKGRGALVVTDAETKDEAGEVLCINTFGAFIRGEGGFGGDRGPSGPRNVPPERAPDEMVEMKTLPQQAAIYRLSGDRNPLHIDPNFAKMAGFDKPILHGLCTFGHVGRAVIQKYCGGDPDRLKGLDVRFSGVVFPGETIITEMWKDSGTQIIVQAKTKERGEVVLGSAVATISA